MTMAGLDLHCFQAYADILEVILYTLAENTRLKPIEIMMELRKVHAKGNFMANIDAKVRCISDMFAKNVSQPLLVMTSVIKLITEIVCMILKVRLDFVFLLSPQMKNGRTAIFE
jgi:T-complex protein 1 subunit delta